MQIKIIVRYHFTPVRMAIIKKSTDNKYWKWYGKKGSILYCLWECRLVQPLWRTVWRFFKKLKIELPYDLAIRLLDIYPEKTEAHIQKGICTPMFIVARTWKQPKYSLTDEWITKLWYMYTIEYYLAIKGKHLSQSCYTEWKKSEREKQIYVNTYIWNLEIWYWWVYF